MSDLKIREFQEADRDAVIALWLDCGIVATVMGGYEGHRGWINYLAVQSSEQRKGYGQEIMKVVETRIEAKGCPKINLQVRAKNAGVIAFYKTLGYCTDDVVGLGKRLPT